MVRRGLLFGALALAACSSQGYTRVAASAGTLEVSPDGVAGSDISGDSAIGDVRIANLGIVRIRVVGPPISAALRGLHVRMVVANRSAHPWTVDVRQQRAVLPGYASSHAAYASARDASPPFVEIPAGDARSLDLIFPLPAPMQQAERVPVFGLVWVIVTGDHEVSAQTTATVVGLVPHRYGIAADVLARGAYWYNPYYLEGMFEGAVPPPPTYEDPAVVIEPAPPSVAAQ